TRWPRDWSSDVCSSDLVEVRIEEPGPGREIPDVAGSYRIEGAPKGTEFDPRAQTLRLPGRGSRGATYTVLAAPAPNAAQLAAGRSEERRVGKGGGWRAA